MTWQNLKKTPEAYHIYFSCNKYDIYNSLRASEFFSVKSSQ